MPRTKKKQERRTAPLHPHAANLLDKISEGKRLLTLRIGEEIFRQGDPADSIFFIQRGKMKVAVVSPGGKEAVIAVLGPHHFIGEGALVGQSLRISTATALEPSSVFRIEKRTMASALHEQAELSEKFIAALLVRNIDLEEDLCDQLFNHSEKRLARVLLKLARLREHDVAPDAKSKSRTGGLSWIWNLQKVYPANIGISAVPILPDEHRRDLLTGRYSS